MQVGEKTTATVREIVAATPLRLAVASRGLVSHIEFSQNPSPEMMKQLAAEVLGQTVEIIPWERVADGVYRGDVWYFRPVEEDGEVEYVYRVSLNAELERDRRSGGLRPANQ